MTRKCFALLLVVVSMVSCLAYQGVTWEVYSPEKMAEVRKSGDPLVVFFTAAWCPVCYELKDKTFIDPRVIAALEHFRRIKVDMSYRHSSAVRKVGDEFEIAGVPTVIFFDPSGNPVSDFHFTGFLSADEFLKAIVAYRNRYPNNRMRGLA